MLFNSIEFFIFLPIVFTLFWSIQSYSLRAGNCILLGASYLFYGWWDWRFLSLIAISSLADFLIGQGIASIQTERTRRGLLFASLLVNLGILGFFKYFNFFIDSLVSLHPYIEEQIGYNTLNVILPVGISFYTFQTLSYTIDVYRGKISACKDPLAFFTFVAFFPQLVAGPIERASHLLPQFQKKSKFDTDWAFSGIQLIVWGFFKKVVIADNCAVLVDPIFTDYASQSSISLVLGAILFGIQIYCDFSGYSDIAIGTARLLGFDLMTNFRFPYLSSNIAEFWRRWHISLSTWFRDYVYIPLGGSRGSRLKITQNVIIVFMVSGLWHGANWTFVFWGLIHAILFLPLILLGSNKNNGSQNRVIIRILKSLGTFSVVCLAWIFFRAESLPVAVEYIQFIFSNTENSTIYFLDKKRLMVVFLIICLCTGLLLAFEINAESKGKTSVMPNKWILSLIALSIPFLGAFKNHANFIYFQF